MPRKAVTEMTEGGGWIVRSQPLDEPSVPRADTKPIEPALLEALRAESSRR